MIIALYGFIYSQISPVSNYYQEDYQRVEVSSGMSVMSISKSLKEKNLIKNSKLFYYSARIPFILKFFYPYENISSNYMFKSGIYYLSPNMNYVEIFELLSSGQTEYISVSIPEGYTILKIADLLEEKRVCSAQDFKASVAKTQILEKYQIPSDTCQGFLFPDTYYFNIDMNSDLVVSMMLDNFFEKIKEVPNLSQKSPEELYEIVTLASIVEREYKIDEEAPLIASVFRNRLRINMGLYSCATIEYIITEIEGKPHPGKILISDTKIESPYNTYKYAGLTPTPISNPGLVALDAATNTPKTNYFYFQVVDEEAGKHVFVRTLEEHASNH
ncbi:MAG: endolytic transglycosylase MltG [Treponema sp.]|nr:endolytic transglycosylase MltG [Treponema sp.]